jgi:hypothetical protein
MKGESGVYQDSNRDRIIEMPSLVLLHPLVKHPNPTSTNSVLDTMSDDEVMSTFV